MKFPDVLTYLIARRQGENLSSRFVSVIEPYKGEPLIKSVREIKLTAGGGKAIEVRRSDGGSDLIVYDAARGEPIALEGGISTDARAAVVRRDASGKVARRFFAGGSFLTVDGDRLEASARTGPVVAVDAAKSEIRVKPDQPQARPEDFTGRVVHFRNDLRQTAHTITSAKRDGDEIVLTASDDLLIGRARVDEVQGETLATRTALPLAPIYRGTVLASATRQPLARVAEVRKGKIVLTASMPEDRRPAAGQDVWLINVGPGDNFELPAVADVAR